MSRSNILPLTFVIAAVAGPVFAGPVKRAAPPLVAPVISLTASPPKVTLTGRYGEARILFEARSQDATGDASSRVTLSVDNPKVAEMDGAGILRARSDGKALLTARYAGRTVQVPVQVRGVSASPPPRFAVDVIPVLTRTGCNAGACHGAGSGKGGFKLSLLGYDPESDYKAITRFAGGRRISRTQPEASLLLRKPALVTAHKGGQRFRVGSPEYRLLADWVAAGMPAPDVNEPKVVRLAVTPAVRTMGVGQTQRYAVRAVLSDGTIRDVTGETVFTASDETVAKVTPDGEAQATGPGEGAVLIRYRDLVATARVVSPFAKLRQTAKSATATDPSARIDQLVQAKLDALGLQPSPLCSDSDFLRRAYLDVIGQLPAPDEARAFLADKDPKRREKLIDALLERSEYVDFWALKWGDILRSNRRVLTEKGMYAFNHWIRQSVAQNKPWDQFARELLLSQGNPYDVGPANYFRTANSPNELAETTSQVFLGVRMQCAKCHNHPYEKWTQNQYYQMAAFFARVRFRKPDGGVEPLVSSVRTGEVVNPRTQKQAAPCALDARPAALDDRRDRREALVEWLTSPQNPFFSRVIVNRVWKHYMGRGLVEPVDDLRVTNPASNQELFDWLAKEFANRGYDLRTLMRAILRSQAYQRAAEPTKANIRDMKYYSHYAFKRLSAEQMMDALASATGVPDKFAGYPIGTHASQLPDAAVPSYFLELFGKPARNIACECERLDEPNLGQVLHLMNNKGLNERLADKNGRVAKLIESKAPDAKVVEELYLASVARVPSADEMKKGVKTLAGAKNRQQAAEDLMWALLNTKEFLFNH
jgi:hypothetical protein